MRNKFTELIEQGVAAFNYTPIAPSIPEQDFVCRMYNNIWSIPSDTHMHLDNTGIRYITGHIVGITDKWDKFVCACNWGAINFRTTGYWSLCDFLQKHGLRGEYGNLNGDNVYMVTPIAEVPGSPVPGEEICKCPVCCPTCCTTTESQIPSHIATLTVDNNPARVKECYKGKSNLYEVCEAMNDSVYVKGTNWTVNGDKIMCPIGNKVVVL